MIAIIDYGVGNLASVRNAFLKLGFEAAITSSSEEILQADKVVLPGVGAFADAMDNLRRYGLDGTVKQVIREDIPFLGICLGLHLLHTQGEEHGIHEGLNIIKGRVVKFELPRAYKVPHMGWNQVWPREDSRLFKGLTAGSHFYFVHSYYVLPDDAGVIAAHSDYGIDFVCAEEKDNMFATQFHPEKSGQAGLQVLRNFAAI
ncbi:imidazole glycerol phosphate synthase amidotransferase subunit [hydrocarbon metagenome]|uniref:Imidazole glycerol phosphate synthase amidotransferase subunit n=1 Tax=hydrocarbon metagenome TaxID=938273 RepID=A0A0W8E4U4_9ZZZZ